MATFSKKYPTYKAWREAQKHLTPYVKKIERLHSVYPQANLNQLRGHPERGQRAISALKKSTGRLPPVNVMAARQRERYELSIEALRYMRRESVTMTEAAKRVGISTQTMKSMVGSALKKKGNKWTVKPNDRLEREMKFYDSKGPTYVSIKTYKAASLIGQYHEAIKVYLESGDHSALVAFRGKQITDRNGKRHKFITDRRFFDRMARTGEIRFESIYKNIY